VATKKIKQIAIYGKVRIGKPTTISNISVVLTKASYKALQVGCDPKSDSTNTLGGSTYIPTVLDTLRTKNTVAAAKIVFEGFGVVYCVAAGGLAPRADCAGRVMTAVHHLKQFSF
jgi:nitrogenase iron protein NifH